MPAVTSEAASTRRWLPALTPDVLAFSVFTILVLLLCLRPVLHSAGWPVNHDGAKMFFRTEVFAAHFSHGDLFPVWSGTDAFGFGTPMPAYYQRLYYSLSGGLLLLTDDVKSATVVSLGLLMATGAAGMRAAVAEVSSVRPLQYAIPGALLLSSYAYTDWLVRGAAAEFSAMMLVPWLLWWSLKLVVSGRYSWWIVAIFPALFYAHNAIALVATPVPLLAFLLHLVRVHRRDGLSLRVLIRPAISAGVTAGLVAPALLMQLRMNRDFDPTNKITQDFSIAGGFRDAHDYVLDRDYTWLTSGGGYTVQLNVVGTITVAALGVLALIRIGRRPRRSRGATALVLLLTGTYAFLQLRASQSVYDALPLLPQIQFPWRMLTLLTPLLLLLIALLSPRAERSTSSRWWALAAGLWLAAYVVASPAIAHDRLPRLATLRSTSDEFYEAGEYTPRTRAPGGGRDLTGSELVGVYSQLRTTPPVCGLQQVAPAFEQDERRYTASCDQTAIEPLPLTYSSYTQVWINGRPVPAIHDAHDPRLHVQLPQGPAQIRVAEPTFWRVLRGVAG